MSSQVKHYKVDVYGISDIGLVRHNNEDSWKYLQEDMFYVLADGMGGHQAGEVASHECVERLCKLFHSRNNAASTLEETKQILSIAIQEVNASIYYLAKQYQKLKGMGTTLCCIFFHSQGLIYAHVGDSRIYRFRDQRLEQLTHDHSLLRELIDLGQLSEQQADAFLYKNIITKAIGTEPHVEPSVKHTAVYANDMFLMCSDGLTDLLSLKEIQEIFLTYSQDKIAQVLVTKAKQKGGHDNITVVLLKVKE